MKAIFALVLFLISFQTSAQSLDTTVVANDSVKGHSIKKAVIFSAVLPGAGQVYNHIAMPKGKKKAFWKVPLIYAGLGTTTYFLINNQNNVSSLKQEYINRLNGGPTSLQWSAYDDSGVLTLFNQYQTWRDLSILAVAGVYVLQIVDAGVEAHFVDFDISEDLTLKIQPTLLNYQTAGVKFSFNFR